MREQFFGSSFLYTVVGEFFFACIFYIHNRIDTYRSNMQCVLNDIEHELAQFSLGKDHWIDNHEPF